MHQSIQGVQMFFVFLDSVGQDLAFRGIDTMQHDMGDFAVFAMERGEAKVHAGIMVVVIEDDFAFQRFTVESPLIVGAHRVIKGFAKGVDIAKPD